MVRAMLIIAQCIERNNGGRNGRVVIELDASHRVFCAKPPIGGAKLQRSGSTK
jgi:hypothetical protein